jgi:dihydroflavonol-4-reductase
VRAFLTGGTGLVGGALLRLLLAQGAEVRALARTDEAAARLAALGAEPVRGRLADEGSLRRGLAGCDVAFNAAGVNAICPRDPRAMVEANAHGPALVVRAAAAAGVARVVHTSSAAVLGERPGAVGPQERPGAVGPQERPGAVGPQERPPARPPRTRYARAKLLGERAALAAGVETGVEVVCVNPASVQGPGRATGTARLLLAAARNPVIVLVRTWISLVDLEDCALAHLLAARRGRPGARYVLSAPPITTARAVEVVRAAAGRPRRVVWLPRGLARGLVPLAGLARLVPARGDPLLCADAVATVLDGHRYDGALAERELGLRCRPAEETIRRQLAWFRAEGLLAGGTPPRPR